MQERWSSSSIGKKICTQSWHGVSHELVKAYDVLDAIRNEKRGAAPPMVYWALDFYRRRGLFIHKIESLNAYFGCGAPGHGVLANF